MKPNGRRAWRKAAKKLRCKMGRRWRSQEEWVYGKRWSEIVPDLDAHRAHVTGAWFKRHGFQSLDHETSSRHYIGLWGTVNGDTIGFVEAVRPFTTRSLVGRSEASKKHLRESIYCGERLPPFVLGADSITKGLRIGERLRPCPGCKCCGYPPPYGKLWTLTKGMWRMGSLYATDIKHICDGSGVLPARRLT